MPKPKRDYPVMRVNLCGTIRTDVPENIAMLKWLDSLPNRKKFPIVWEILKAGGRAIQSGAIEADIDEAEAMAEEFFNAFVA